MALLIRLRNVVFSFLYAHFFKPFFFRRDPEDVHERMARVGIRLGESFLGRSATTLVFGYANPILEQTILGMHFKNPVGLAAGFDKNAQLTAILPSVGFGFAEVGSVTGEPCEGNPRPRLWRLPQSKSLAVYYGLKNDGCEAIAARLATKKFRMPIGVSIAKTNNPATCDIDTGIADYAKAFRAFACIGNYITVNISCPNAYGGEPFTDPILLEKLFAVLDGIPTTHPIFIKLSPDLPSEQIDAILAVIERHRVHGIICSNLTKNRVNEKIRDMPVPQKGGISGKAVQDLADQLIAHVWKRTRGKYVIIGCGGVFTAEDAYKKIRLGASLIQMITGMIYQGPQVVSEINQGLARLLERDGYRSIQEAVGVDHR